MSYYITAHRKGNHLAIPIEEKHLYKNGWRSTVIKTYSTTPPQQNYLDTEDVAMIAQIDDIEFVHGTGESNLIGNKIFLKDVNVTLNVRASFGLMEEINGGSPSVDYFSNCRVMVVQFDDDMDLTDENFCDWFRTTYIYYDSITVNQKQVAIQSVHQNRMRESTPWTGRFRIIKDIPFKVTKEKTCLSMSFPLVFKKDLTLMAATGQTTLKPVNDDFKHIYVYFLGPGNYTLDNDAMTAKNLSAYIGGGSTSKTFFELAFNIKYTFYDLN